MSTKNNQFKCDSSSSSIGKNSENDNVEVEEAEVSSNPFESVSSGSIQYLNEALPTRKGVSRHYDGKSKSYNSLADCSSLSSINDIAKPDNAYSRRQRNKVARNIILNKYKNSWLKSSGGVTKKFINSRRTTLALGVAMSSSKGDGSGDDLDVLKPEDHIGIECHDKHQKPST